MTPPPNLQRLIDATRQRQRILALDPGGTIGYATGEIQGDRYNLVGWQSNGGSLDGNIRQLSKTIHHIKPDVIVCESYRIYSSKLKEHVNSEVPTIQLIGAIRLLALQVNSQLVMQSAQQGKGFVTDDKLRQWQYYTPGSPHANDAIRHLIHYLIFPLTK